jgi:hypothetical protein
MNQFRDIILDGKNDGMVEYVSIFISGLANQFKDIENG